MRHRSLSSAIVSFARTARSPAIWSPCVPAMFVLVALSAPLQADTHIA